MIELSSKDYRFLELAERQAQYSDMISKHGCVITQNGKPIASGFNTEFRKHSSDGIICNPLSCHAEICALRNASKVVQR